MKRWGIQRNKVHALWGTVQLPNLGQAASSCHVPSLPSIFFFFLKENTIYFLSAPQEYCGDECTVYLKLLANLEKNLRTSKALTKLEQSLGTGYIGPHNGRFPSHSGRKRYRWVQGSFQEHSSHLNHFQCAWLKPNLMRRKITSCCLNTLEGLWLSSSYSLWEKAS